MADDLITERTNLLASLALRYIWWRDPEPPSDERIIAQVMSVLPVPPIFAALEVIAASWPFELRWPVTQ
jgi:hypothetical protein